MNRNRVFIAVGIIVLILIGLIVWLGDDDGSETPVAGQSQTETGATAVTASSAPLAVDEDPPADGSQADDGQADDGQAEAALATEPGEAEPPAAETTTSGTATLERQAAGGAAPQTQAAAATSAGGQGGGGSAADGQAGAMTSGAAAPGRVAEAGAAGQAAGDSGRTSSPGTRQDAAAPSSVPDEGGSVATAPAASGRMAEITAARDPATGPAGARPPAPATAAGKVSERHPAMPETAGPETARPEVATRQAEAGAQVAALPETAEETAAHERSTRNGAGPAPRDAAPAVPDGSGFPLPSFDIVRISRDCRAVIAGRAMPRALVVVSLGEDRLGEVMADRRGEWVLIPDEPLRAGSGEMRLSAMPQDGPAVQGSEGVIVSVPDCANPDGEREEIIAVRTDDRDNQPSRILQLPGMSGPGGDLRLDTVDYDEAGKLILSGRAEPSTRVNIYANNAPVGQVHSDSEGRWSLLVDDKVPVGQQTLRLDQVGDRGVVKSRVEFPFSRASFSDLDLRDRSVIVQPGNSLWRIARRIYGEGPRFTVIYRANSEQIRDPDLIYPGQIFSLPEGGTADRG